VQRRSILHVDLDPFIVSVERSQHPEWRGRPVVVGGRGRISAGIVAAASLEARGQGVKAGQSLAQARQLCPDALICPGDLEAYARASDDVTAVLLEVSRRVERPSADEAYVDLTREGPGGPNPATLAEQVKDQLQRRLGLDAALGLASCRLAARVASRWARPRGLLVVLPGYEASYLDAQPIKVLPDLPPHLERSLERAGFTTLGSLRRAEADPLAAAVGSVAATRLQAVARGNDDVPVALAAPPTSVRIETTLRSPQNDRDGLLQVLDGLAARAWRRLRPFGLAAGSLGLEVRRGGIAQRASLSLDPPVADEATGRVRLQELGSGLLDSPHQVRSLEVRLARLVRPVLDSPQAPLFPEAAGAGRHRLL